MFVCWGGASCAAHSLQKKRKDYSSLYDFLSLLNPDRMTTTEEKAAVVSRQNWCWSEWPANTRSSADIPKWCVSSLSFMFSEKTAGDTFLLESSLTFMSCRLDTNLSRLDPGTKKSKSQQRTHDHMDSHLNEVTLTRCMVLCDFERIKSSSKPWPIGEKSNPLSCYLWRCVPVTQPGWVSVQS